MRSIFAKIFEKHRSDSGVTSQAIKLKALQALPTVGSSTMRLCQVQTPKRFCHQWPLSGEIQGFDISGYYDANICHKTEKLLSWAVI